MASRRQSSSQQFAAAQRSLERAKQRGRVDEIRAAALAIGRARQRQLREDMAALAAETAKQMQQQERQRKLTQPQTPAERRSAASFKGWQTRRKLSGFSGYIFAVHDNGELFSQRRSDLSAAERDNQDTVLRDFAPGQVVWGTYTVADSPEQARFWCGVIVYNDENGEQQYRYIPRALTESEAMANVEALAKDYKVKAQICAVVPLL